MLSLSKLRLLLGVVAISALSVAGVSHADDFPTHAVRMIVPFSPGGSSDILARLITKDAEKYLGQPIVIVNKPGAAAMIGLNELVDAKPDGYTIGITNSGMVTQPLYGIAKHNYVTDIQALAQIGEIPFVLAVKGDSPWKTIDDFIAYAKANPDKLNYGITGIGNTSHIGPEHLKSLAKFKMEAVNFDGGGVLINSLLGGHIQAAGINPIDIREHVKAGRIRVLVVFGEKRMDDELFKDVPTAKEKGYNVIVTLWQGIGAPKNLPPEVQNKLSTAFKEIITSDEIKTAVRNLGMAPEYLGPDDFAKKWVNEQEHYKKVVTETGILDLVKSQAK